MSAGATPNIDRLLARRGVRHNTLGPTGARVFCPHLENAFGLRGRFCFVHDREGEALIDPARLSLSVNGELLEGNRAACMWYPSHARRQVKELGLGVVESKFISWDDVLCDVVTLTNHTEEAMRVRLEVQTAATEELARTGKDTLVGNRKLYGQRVWLVLAMTTTRTAPAESLICELKLKAGEQMSLLIAMAVGLRQNDTQKALGRWANCEDPLTEQQRQYQRWFDVNCPRFDCPDERLVRLWWYRWFVVRHNLTDPRLGALQRPMCYPGKSGGLARLSCDDALPLLRELRWLRDPVLVHGQMLAYLDQQSEEGLYEDGWLQAPAEAAALNQPLDATVALPAAFGEVLQVQPEIEFLGRLADSVAQNLVALRRLRDPDNDLLLTDGKESGARVDSTALFAASLAAAGYVLARAGKSLDAKWHEGLAQKVTEALLDRLWSDWDRFFMDLPAAGAELPTRAVRSLLPLALGLAPDDARYDAALAVLLDQEQFWTAYPVAELALQTAAKASVRPVLNAMAADVMAEAIRHQREPITRGKLMEFLWLNARLLCEEDDCYRPQSRETFDGQNGVGAGAVDVLLDNFNDVIIRVLAGLSPQWDETLVVDPLAAGWTYFSLRDVPYRGHLVSVIWENRPEGDRPASTPVGLTVIVDGQVAAQSPSLEKMEIVLD